MLTQRAARAAPTSAANTNPKHPGTRLQEGQYETSVPPVRDRIVQAACKIVLEPVFEAGMLDCSFGFRPGRSAHDALQVLMMSAGGDGGGWLRRTSPAAFRRFRMRS
jgi:RNA-directed DNA polymerase